MSPPLSAFLAANGARSFCRRCLAEALETSLVVVSQAINDMLTARDATLEITPQGTCSSCRATTTVIRARPSLPG